MSPILFVSFHKGNYKPKKLISNLNSVFFPVCIYTCVNQVAATLFHLCIFFYFLQQKKREIKQRGQFTVHRHSIHAFTALQKKILRHNRAPFISFFLKKNATSCICRKFSNSWRYKMFWVLEVTFPSRVPPNKPFPLSSLKQGAELEKGLSVVECYGNFSAHIIAS